MLKQNCMAKKWPRGLRKYHAWQITLSVLHFGLFFSIIRNEGKSVQPGGPSPTVNSGGHYSDNVNLVIVTLLHFELGT